LRCALLDSLRRQPGGDQLLGAAYEGVHLVGGAVRDLLAETGTDWGDTRSARIPKLASARGACLPASVGESPRELDVVVEGEIEPLLRALGGEAHVHDRFGTATVSVGGARIDVARARRERYPRPGALPEVEPAPLAEDLRRRDFTVNALAVALAGAHQGEMTAVEHACEDLAAGRLRVLHARSFRDDPTRLLRLARYRARLGFAVEEGTAALAAAAVAQGALSTVSAARVGAELRLALGEADAVAALTALDDLGVHAALHPRLRFDAELARDALALLPVAEGGAGPDPRPDLLLLAVLLQPLAADLTEDGVERDLHALLDGWEFPAAERDLVLRAATGVEVLADELGYAESGSEIYEVVSGEPLEGVALAGAWAGPLISDAGCAADRWLAELHNVRLQITGADLLAAGIPEGPEIGRRLQDALCAKLDGELDDSREAELAAALGRDGVE
jgi:tRNA nucleotidyltransferase (CCA-adding enzyme)